MRLLPAGGPLSLPLQLGRDAQEHQNLRPRRRSPYQCPLPLSPPDTLSPTTGCEQVPATVVTIFNGLVLAGSPCRLKLCFNSA